MFSRSLLFLLPTFFWILDVIPSIAVDCPGHDFASQSVNLESESIDQWLGLSVRDIGGGHRTAIEEPQSLNESSQVVAKNPKEILDAGGFASEAILACRYKVQNLLGSGAHGRVYRCLDEESRELVAIKVLDTQLSSTPEALSEVQILQDLVDSIDGNHARGVVKLKDYFYHRGRLCIVTELLPMNLLEVMKVHRFEGLSLSFIRQFAIQILDFLTFLNEHHIVHCDLKPENVMFVGTDQAEIRVIDFSLSHIEGKPAHSQMQTIWYRSPEVLLDLESGMPMDMWSLGCILAELYTGKPLFPGKNETHQLQLIKEFLGFPQHHENACSLKKATLNDQSLDTTTGVFQTKDYCHAGSGSQSGKLQIHNSVDDNFMDFVSGCLEWDANARLTPQEAIEHIFVTGL